MNKTHIPLGQERFVVVNGSAKGSLWNGLYQFQGTVFWMAHAVVFGMTEWGEVKDALRFEMVKGDELLRSCTGDAARAGHVIDTPNGKRWAVPLEAWAEE